MKGYLAMTKENYFSLTITELSACKHTWHEYLCESIFLGKHNTSQSYLSAVFFDVPPDIIRENCDFTFIYHMTPRLLYFVQEKPFGE